MTRVLVTGATGFIGRALIPLLMDKGFDVTVASRSGTPGDMPDGVHTVTVSALDGDTDWTEALKDVDTVVHLAARVHVMSETAADPLAAFRAVNVDGTRALAEQAATAGVRRFVFLSSIKVNGESTPIAPFSEDQLAAPEDAYGLSKWEAEQVLIDIAGSTPLEPVIVRPPLVYGAGVKGNFLTLLRAAAKGLPLPLGRADNRRSLIYVGNLADAIFTCLTHPLAGGRTFLVSDGDAPSVSALYTQLGRALGRAAWTVPVPRFLLRLAGILTGKGAAVGRLLDSLLIDDRQIRDILDWHPPYSLDQGLAETARWYRTRRDGQRKRTDPT